MIYNTSNFTGNNLYDLALAPVQLEPLVGPIIVMVVFFIAYLATQTRNDPEVAFLTAGWISSLLVIFFWPIGFVTSTFASIIIGGTLIFTFLSTFWR